MTQYTEAQIKTITDAGYSLDKAGKIRDKGAMVSTAMAEQIVAGNMFANFDINDLKKKKARKAATGGESLVDALAKISPAIALLKVGGTTRLPIPTEAPVVKVKGVEKKLDPLRSFVQSIVTKLNSITAADGEWAGRKFDTVSNDSRDFLYITRLEDVAEPHVRKTSPGRKPKNSTDNLNSALERSRQHLSAGKGDADDNKPTTEENKAVDAIVDGGAAQVGGENQPEVIEEATVLKH